MLSISHGSNLKCTRLGRDTTNGLRSTWQIHSFHVSPKSPRLAQTHRLIRSGGLSPLKDGSGKPTAAPHPNELDPMPNLDPNGMEKHVNAKTVRGFRKIEKNMASHCTSHGSAFLWHRADCCVASQCKTMTSDSKFGRFFIHVWCNWGVRHLDTQQIPTAIKPSTAPNVRSDRPVFLSLQRITTHLCRLSQPSAF